MGIKEQVKKGPFSLKKREAEDGIASICTCTALVGYGRLITSEKIVRNQRSLLSKHVYMY